MCGIVGYVGYRDATPLIIDGLERLEYRGYDSAGIAVMQDGAIALRRDVGKLANLRAKLESDPISGHIGIGHTRWATHGAPAEHNAHPHVSMNGDFVVVHNGIVENYLELREELTAEGVEFKSDTDTEVIVQLVARFADDGAHGDVTEATRQAVGYLKGAHAIVVMSKRQPDRLVAVRIGNAGGVAVGLGEGENFIASDIPAILEQTRRMIFLESRQMATVTADDAVRANARRHAGRAANPRYRLGPGQRRERRIQALHAEGDFRAGAQPDRHHSRARRLRARGSPAARTQPDAGTGASASSASSPSPAARATSADWSASSTSSSWRG